MGGFRRGGEGGGEGSDLSDMNIFPTFLSESGAIKVFLVCISRDPEMIFIRCKSLVGSSQCRYGNGRLAHFLHFFLVIY